MEFWSYVLALLAGFSVSIAAIAVIGAQSLYILKLAISRQYMWMGLIISIISDATLLSLGILGGGLFFESFPTYQLALSIAAIVFLTFFCVRLLYTAYKYKPVSIGSPIPIISRKEAFITLAFVTWLNPHVYLDTVVIIGSVGADQPIPDRYFFLVGGVLASVSWFSLLTLAGYKLTNLIQTAKFWKILNVVMALVVLSIAIRLIVQLVTD